jgi:hypothetical protein
MTMITARHEEWSMLERLYRSNDAEFLAIYGRRRVGKTILISAFCEAQEGLFFNVSGTRKTSMSVQLSNFIQRIGEVFYNGVKLQEVKTWREAFQVLTDAIKTLPQDKKIMIFFDEFPWMSTKNSRLLQNLDYYWNQYWSRDSRIKLIICGSSASWIINKIIRNKGGLHNRITQEIHLEPFNLADTKEYLNSRGINLNNKQIVEVYMALGGIPYYLRRIEKGMSATQIIESLAFHKKSFLLEEFDKLFEALFDDAEIYKEIVRSIAQKRYGISQTELIKKISGLTQGGEAKRKLLALEETGFIMRFKPYGFKRKGNYYRVTDEYTLFYFHWIEPVKDSLHIKALKSGYWEAIHNTPAWYSWSGLAFETICYNHLTQISNKLKLPATTIADCWRYTPVKGEDDNGAQIDLLFDRYDDAITLCDIKFTKDPFVVDKSYAASIQRKISVFQKQTGTNKQIFIVLISANDIKSTMYSEELVSSVVTLDDLFQSDSK